MKHFFTQSSSHAHSAAIKNIMETDAGREAHKINIFEVKVVTKRWARMRMFVRAVKVGERGCEVVKIAVEFCTTERGCKFYHFLVEVWCVFHNKVVSWWKERIVDRFEQKGSYQL